MRQVQSSREYGKLTEYVMRYLSHTNSAPGNYENNDNEKKHYINYIELSLPEKILMKDPTFRSQS